MNNYMVVKNVFFNVVSPFFFWLPFRMVRYLFLKQCCAKLGDNVFVGRNVDIRDPYKIVIGEGTIINKRVVLDGRGGLTIGKNVDIDQDVNIWSEQHDYDDDLHSLQKKSVYIGDYVWI